MIIIGDKILEGMAIAVQQTMHGAKRPALELHITGSSYAELSELFVDNAAFSLRHDGQDYDQSEYCLAGPITDHRDGSFSVIVGKKTVFELEREAKEQVMLELLTERGAIV